MPAQKIVNNLFLGSMYDVPNDSDYVISISEEFYDKNVDFNKFPVSYQTDNHFYYRAKDDPMNDGEIHLDVVKKIIKLIDEEINNNKKVYVHCIYGINRSASHVFMYLVSKKLLPTDNFELAIKKFQDIYSKFSPLPSWKRFLKNNYPFKDWI